MTIAVNQEVNNSATGSSGTVAQSISNTQAGAVLAAYFICASGQTLASVADTQGNTWVVKDTIVEPTNLFRLTSAYAVNIAGGAGANTVTGNFSAAVTNRAIIMGEIRGAAVAPFDVSGGQNQGGGGPGTGTDAVTTGNVTPTKSPSLVYALGMACGNNVMSAGTGFTLGQQLSAILSSSVSLATENKRLTSTSAQAATFTQSTALRTLALQMVFDELVAGGFGLSQLSNQGGF
jgi:hypothetical protein